MYCVILKIDDIVYVRIDKLMVCLEGIRHKIREDVILCLLVRLEARGDTLIQLLCRWSYYRRENRVTNKHDERVNEILFITHETSTKE